MFSAAAPRVLALQYCENGASAEFGGSGGAGFRLRVFAMAQIKNPQAEARATQTLRHINRRLRAGKTV
jgi:hypothetical protein